MRVRITLAGCDDTTRIDLDVTKEQYEFLVHLNKLSGEASEYGCQPVLYVGEIQ